MLDHVLQKHQFDALRRPRQGFANVDLRVVQVLPPVDPIVLASEVEPQARMGRRRAIPLDHQAHVAVRLMKGIAVPTLDTVSAVT